MKLCEANPGDTVHYGNEDWIFEAACGCIETAAEVADTYYNDGWDTLIVPTEFKTRFWNISPIAVLRKMDTL